MKLAKPLTVVFVAITASLAVANPPNADFFIAPDGNDANPGTCEKPFATLVRARDAIRVQKRKQPDRDYTVLLRGGEYRLAETVVFGLDDSAANGHTVTCAAYPGETPTLTSGVPVTGWKKVEGQSPGLPEAARGKTWVAALPSDLTRFNMLFDGATMLPRARSAGAFPTKSYSHRNQVDRTELHFPSGLIRSWPNLGDVEVVIVPGSPWTMNILPLDSVDESTGIARTAVPATYAMGKPRFGHFPNGALWVENALECLDEPGEWVVNMQTRQLYLWPVGTKPSENIVASRLTELIRVEGKIDYEGPADTPVRGIVFRGLTFTQVNRFTWEKEKTGWGLQHDWEMFDRPTAMLRFRGAESCAVENCRFVNTGATAVRFDLHAQDNQVQNCVIDRIGGTGVLLAGYGPGTKDVNKNNVVRNNRISRVGKLLWHSPAVFVWQSGANRIEHNEIHHTPYTAIVVSGRIGWVRNGIGECSRTVRWTEVDRARSNRPPKPLTWYEREPFMHGRKNLVAFNDIHHVMEVLGDGNCIYVSGTGDANRVENNYLHDVTSPRINANIRCDDDQHGTIMRNNVIFRCCGEGFIIKGANTIENNIVADLRSKGADGTTCLHQRGYLVFPYSSVKGAIVRRNIFLSCEPGQNLLCERQSKRRGDALLRDCDADNNLYWCTADPQWGKKHLATQRAFGIEKHSICAPPDFVNLDAGDFRLAPDSPALKLGFRPIDLGSVGPGKSP